jgi:hypothetical protein
MSQRSAWIAAATATALVSEPPHERGDAASFLVDALEAGDDRDLAALLEALDQLGAVHVGDMRGAVGVVGENRQLPALPGARGDPHLLQDDGEQPGAHLLARGDHGVIFTRVVHGSRLPAPFDELVGGAGHGRHDNGDLMAGVDLALDVLRDVTDAVEIGDRSAAELHDEPGHKSSTAKPRKGAYRYRRVSMRATARR